MDKKWWEDRPWRQVQTNLRQIDMLDMDAEQYVKELKAFDATVAMINVGGILASYPTDLPYHTQSEWLKGDSLKKVIDACHAADIRVVARTDFSKIREPVYQMHPDWAYRTSEGKIVNYNGDVHACICGGFQQECALEIIREICRKLPVDGLFMNMGGFVARDYSYNFYGICHCENCRRKFRESAGMELPRSMDMKDPVYRAYRRFQRKVIQDQNERIVALCREINPQIAINGIDFLRMESNTEYKRPLPFWQYSGSSNSRCLRGTTGEGVVTNTSVDFIGFYYRHVGVGPSQQGLRIWQAIANLGNPDYYLIGRLDNHMDRSSYKALQEAFHFHKEHEQDYLYMHSIADALVIRGHLWGDSSAERGWIRALTENHILFDESTIENALKGGLDRYRTVILPGTQELPRTFVNMLNSFVRNGGTLIADAFPGRYDGEYEPYEANPLSEIMGICAEKTVRDDMVSAMFRLSDEDKVLLPSFREHDCDVIAFGDQYQYNEYTPDTRRVMTMIPPQMYGPPERCYTYEHTDWPGLTVHPFGKGQGIYIPWKAGGIFTTEGYMNTFWFLKDVLESVAGLGSVAQQLTPMVEVACAVREDGSYMLVQTVNTTGCFGTSYFEPVPVDLSDNVCVPCGKKVGKAVRLTDGSDIPFEQEGNMVRLSIGKIGVFESVKLFLE